MLFLHFHKRWFGRRCSSYWRSVLLAVRCNAKYCNRQLVQYGVLKFNGAKFSATDYPVLAKVFPSLVLPEARGDFIRIWDDGRGADSGRALLSWQAATSLSQFGGNYPEGSGHAIADYDGISAHQPGFSRFQYTSNSVGDGVNFIAVRPRNIAFNFLVRAK